MLTSTIAEIRAGTFVKDTSPDASDIPAAETAEEAIEALRAALESGDMSATAFDLVESAVDYFARRHGT